ncbi:MAG: hypothetical protein GQ570_07780 [Helicobacteraceae bacterium]|nr:hypothetical protein [Helicobacteraceae bacterium]
MIISVMNLKGGVGKSSISFQLAQFFKLKMITNDANTGIMNIKILKGNSSIEVNEDRLYDFGGFDDIRIHEVLASSNVVVVPTLYSRADLQNTVRTVRKVKKLNPEANIIVTINRVRSGDSKQLNSAKASLEKYIDFGVQYCQIRDSKVMLHSLDSGKSIFDIHKSSKLNRHVYTGIINDFYALIGHIEEFIDDGKN